MIREKELDDDKILNTLQEDPIERNQQLTTLLRLLNSINENSTLTIDGNWGSGKTVFVKQIDYLNKHDVESIKKLDQETIQSFQNEYTTYYYNAWKNDYHEDPLQSLLFNLINDLWGAREKAADATTKVSKAFFNSVLKTTSLGLYDPEEIRKAQNISDLTKSITTASERKNAIDDIINNHLDLKDKKILFIIDELDRCKPTFAVKLLEVIKHYYTNDRLVFLLSTNNQQLSHTIKRVYGESFDGIGYLNKFYDLIFNLPDVQADKYINYLGSKSSSSYWKDAVPYDVVKHLDLSMREINRYYSSLRLIEHYMASTNSFSDNETSAQLVKYIFIPFAYGLRIHNSSDYDKFVRGRGSNILGEFCAHSDIAHVIIQRSDEEQDPVDAIKHLYTKLFTTDRSSNTDEYHIIQSAETFKRMVSLMNSSGVIDENRSTEEDSK